MNILIIIITLLWFSAAISLVPTIAPHTNKLNIYIKIIIMIVIVIGAPFMLITQAIETILDGLLPEGWNDDDNFSI